MALWSSAGVGLASNITFASLAKSPQRDQPLFIPLDTSSKTSRITLNGRSNLELLLIVKGQCFPDFCPRPTFGLPRGVSDMPQLFFRELVKQREIFQKTASLCALNKSSVTLPPASR